MKSLLFSLFAACVVLFAFVSLKPSCIGASSYSDSIVVASGQFRPEAFLLQGDSDIVRESRFRKKTAFTQVVNDYSREIRCFDFFRAPISAASFRGARVIRIFAFSDRGVHPPSVRILLI